MKMNGFRLAGDLVFLSALIAPFVKILMCKSCAGISGKTQILLALMFTTRYLDLFINVYSAYTSEMKNSSGIKILFLCLIYASVLFVYVEFGTTYQRNLDTFRFEFLIFAALIVALVVPYNYKNEYNGDNVFVFNIFWAFSEYLEAVAALPQLFFNYKTRKVHIVIFYYLSALATYRLFYIMNWIHRYMTQVDYLDLRSVVSGSVEIILFSIFWFACATKAVLITREDSAWLAQNLTEVNDKNGIFIIKFDKNSKPDKLPLLKNLEDTAESNYDSKEGVASGDCAVAKLAQCVTNENKSEERY